MFSYHSSKTCSYRNKSGLMSARSPKGNGRRVWLNRKWIGILTRDAEFTHLHGAATVFSIYLFLVVTSSVSLLTKKRMKLKRLHEHRYKTSLEVEILFSQLASHLVSDFIETSTLLCWIESSLDICFCRRVSWLSEVTLIGNHSSDSVVKWTKRHYSYFV